MAEAAQVYDEVVWEPQEGPQYALVTCPVFEVLYGGARGGGKTDGMLGEWIDHSAEYGSHANGVFFRRELTQLDEAIERSKEIYNKLGARWHEQKKSWTFPNGARLKFRYLDRDSDAEGYQGHSYTRVYFEELTNFPSKGPVDKLRATLRSGHGVPCCFRATANPGGPGHHWVKARYIDPAPKGYEILTETFRNPFTGEEQVMERVFIPSKLSDNRILMEGDPGYVPRLYQSGSAALVKAWLEGDWSIVEGAYFDCFDPGKHIIEPFAVPDHWLRIRAFDWGSAKPFSYGEYAVSDGEPLPDGRQYPTGAMIQYLEWYGAQRDEQGQVIPDVGLKMTAEQVAAGIRERAHGKTFGRSVADPAIFAEDGGPSIAERMLRAGVQWNRADNKRVSRGGAMGGWDQVRARLVGDDRPMLYFFDTCTEIIRTLPALQHDELRPEDVDSSNEDHAADGLRYAAMARPYVKNAPEAQPPIKVVIPTFNDIMKRHQRRR